MDRADVQSRPDVADVFPSFNQHMIDTILRNVEKHAVARVFLLPPEGPFGDYPPTDGGDWCEEGVLVINYIGSPIYLLNAEDDLKWVARDRLTKVAGAFAGIIRDVEGMTKDTIGAFGLRGFKRKIKLAKVIARWKTTKFGPRPLY